MKRQLIQYILLRKDLKAKPFSFQRGSLCSQAVHAAVSQIHLSQASETKEFLSDLMNMHTVVLAVKDEEELLAFEMKCRKSGIEAYAWREQPEDIVTSLAVQPILRDVGKDLFAGLKLFN